METPELAYSIKMKIKLYKRFCKEKDPHKKQNHERQFKTYHNLISALLGETKNLITNNTLVTTKKTLKLLWQTIKEIINMKKNLMNLFPAS